MEFSDYSFKKDKNCGTADSIEYRLNLQTLFNGEEFLTLSEDGKKLTVQTTDTSLAESFPVGSYGYAFSIDALVNGQVMA